MTKEFSIAKNLRTLLHSIICDWFNVEFGIGVDSGQIQTQKWIWFFHFIYCKWNIWRLPDVFLQNELSDKRGKIWQTRSPINNVKTTIYSITITHRYQFHQFIRFGCTITWPPILVTYISLNMNWWRLSKQLISEQDLSYWPDNALKERDDVTNILFNCSILINALFQTNSNLNQIYQRDVMIELYLVQYIDCSNRSISYTRQTVHNDRTMPWYNVKGWRINHSGWLIVMTWKRLGKKVTW